MKEIRRKKRYAVVTQSDCVACGCCVKVCPLSAIAVVRGRMREMRKGMSRVCY